ncbi:MAG: hypothetical protein ACTSRU_01800 [Candidatus Hodarchaeales archaeon]
MAYHKYKTPKSSKDGYVHIVHANWAGSGKTNVSWRFKGSKWTHNKIVPKVKDAKKFAEKKAKKIGVKDYSYYDSQANPLKIELNKKKSKSKAKPVKKRKVKRKPRKAKRPKDIFDVLGKLF